MPPSRRASQLHAACDGVHEGHEAHEEGAGAEGGGASSTATPGKQHSTRSPAESTPPTQGGSALLPVLLPMRLLPNQVDLHAAPGLAGPHQQVSQPARGGRGGGTANEVDCRQRHGQLQQLLLLVSWYCCWWHRCCCCRRRIAAGHALSLASCWRTVCRPAAAHTGGRLGKLVQPRAAARLAVGPASPFSVQAWRGLRRLGRVEREGQRDSLGGMAAAAEGGATVAEGRAVRTSAAACSGGRTRRVRCNYNCSYGPRRGLGREAGPERVRSAVGGRRVSAPIIYERKRRLVDADRAAAVAARPSDTTTHAQRTRGGGAMHRTSYLPARLFNTAVALFTQGGACSM